MATGAAAGSKAIDVRLERIEQLFHTMDPFPFRERNLASEAEDFIAGIAGDLPRRDPLKIVFHVPADGIAKEEAEGLAEAVRNFYLEKIDDLSRELRELFREGRQAAAVGLSILFVCVLLDSVVLPSTSLDKIGFLSEGFVILGWVANWKPLEIFLYDWRPIAAKRRLYRRLADAAIELRTDGGVLG